MADDAGQNDVGDAQDAGSGTDDQRPVTSLEDLQAELEREKLTPGQAFARIQAARKWETRAKENVSKAKEYDKVAAELEEARKANMSATEKDLEKLRSEAHATGAAEARAIYGSQAVQARFEGLLAGRNVEAERLAVLVDNLPTSKYLNDDGSIDKAELAKYADAVAPRQETSTANAGFGLGAAAFGAGHSAPAGGGVPGAAGLAEARRRGFITDKK